MATDDPAATLKNGIASALDSSEYSDLIITCKGKVFAAHRVVVCTQSRFFRNTCKKDTFEVGQKHPQESRTGNIDLLEDNPLAVEAMYQYFYKFDYSNLAKDDPEALLLHVRVYCLAHKYEIDALKALAAKLFLRTAGDDFSVATFPAIIKEIYENTDTSDTTLRKVAVEVAIENHDALFEDGAEEFSAMMTDIGEFGRDVFKAMAASRMIVKKAKKGVEVYYCRIDNVHWKVDLNTASPTFRITKTCPGCQATALSPSSSPNHSFNIYTCTQCRVSCGSTRHWVTSVSLLCPYCNTKATHLEA